MRAKALFFAAGIVTTSWFSPGCGGSKEDTGAVAGAANGGDSGSANATGGGSGGTTSVITFGGTAHSGSGGGGREGDGGQCGGDEVRAVPAKVNLLFVIDRSESMDAVPLGFTASKWQTVVAALEESLAGIRGKMGVGLQFFPDPRAGSEEARCGMPMDGELTIPIGETDADVALIEQRLDDAMPTGSTPAADALALAREYFATGAGAALSGKRYILLALDGGPNCNDGLSCGADTESERGECTLTYDKPDSCGAAAPFNCCSGQPEGCLDATRVVSEVEQLREAGVATLVVGIPGSESYGDVLDQLARSGGAPASDESPQYFKVDDPDELRDALSSLPFELIKTCDLQLESEPPDPRQVNVYLDSALVPRLGEDGWELDSSTAPSTIHLKGATCTKVESEGVKSIRVEFGCPTVDVPR